MCGYTSCTPRFSKRFRPSCQCGISIYKSLCMVEFRGRRSAVSNNNVYKCNTGSAIFTFLHILSFSPDNKIFVRLVDDFRVGESNIATGNLVYTLKVLRTHNLRVT